MQEIYRENGSTFLAREIQAKLNPGELIQIMASNSVDFAFWEMDKKIYLHESQDTKLFWEEEVKPNLCRASSKKYLKKPVKKEPSIDKATPYCYFASLWESETLEKIIVLFSAH